MNVVDTINQQGSAAGVPPDVTQRIISVTIHKRKDATAMATPTPPAADGSSPQQRKFDEEPPMVIDTAKRYVATMTTSHGTMVIALDPLAAPKAVNSFVFLARYHYFDGIVFHRIIPGFVLQGGDPTGTGSGGPGYRFADELPAAGPLQGRVAGHGQRGAQHQRQPVLRDQRPRRGAPAAALLALRRGRQRARRRHGDRRHRQPLRHADRAGRDRERHHRREGLNTHHRRPRPRGPSWRSVSP